MSTVRRTLIPGAAALAAGLALLVGGVGLAGAARAAEVSVEVSSTTDLPAEGGTVTVSGSGFTVAGPGIYVGLAAADGYDPSNPDSFGVVTWVKPGGPDGQGMATLQADGSFETTLEVPAVFGEGAGAVDCRETQCAIYTLAAHGSPDRSQDTVTELAFAGSGSTGTAPDPDSEVEAIAGPASPSAQARAVDTAAGGSSTSTGVVVGLVIAGLLLAAILAYALVARRRSGRGGSPA